MSNLEIRYKDHYTPKVSNNIDFPVNGVGKGTTSNTFDVMDLVHSISRYKERALVNLSKVFEKKKTSEDTANKIKEIDDHEVNNSCQFDCANCKGASCSQVVRP